MRIACAVSSAVVLLLTAACSPPDEGDSERSGERTPALAFEYVGKAPSGSIDQTLTIANPSADTAVIPTLSFIALDDEGDELEQVRVETAFGSDRGLVMAPADYEVFDILAFEGAGSTEVVDVLVEVETVRTLPDARSVYPEVEYLDAQLEPVDLPYLAHTVRVLNSGQRTYSVRLVGIRWDQPLPGRSQQAEQVTAVAGPITVDAGSDTDIAIPKELRGQFDSLKAYITSD